jgi:two-component system cell cycle response regulator DivK
MAFNKRSWGGAGNDNVVLIIEDDVNLRENIEFLLKAERIRTMSASNGMSGLALIRRHRPKVVILDMYLPHMSGFEVLDDIRKDPLLEGIFVIAVTAMASDPDDLRMMKGQADVIMSKPINDAYMLELIEAAFAHNDTTGLRRHRQDA